MRTTIRLDDNLYAEVKRFAAESRSTVTAVIESALREMLGRRKEARKLKRVKLPAHGRGGLQPGIDLDRSADLWDLVDSDRGSP